MSYEDVLFQNPGPTNIPSRVLEAMRRPALDHRGQAFAKIFDDCQDGLQKVFKTTQPVVTFPSTGHGAWEASLVNMFSPGDTVLVLVNGYFGSGWADYANRFGLKVRLIEGDPRKGIDFIQVANALREDRHKQIKGVLVTHCETSTGVMTDCGRVRDALDEEDHPAYLLVDVISSLGCADFRMDEWRIDVAVAASQKGLMMATGLGFTAVSLRALEASRTAALPRAYWDWQQALSGGKQLNFPGTAPVQLLYGLQESLHMLFEEGLACVLERHAVISSAVRAAGRKWSLGGDVELGVEDAVASPSVTALMMVNGEGADQVRKIALEKFKVQLGSGFADHKDKSFRIGHMGALTASQTMGVLAAVEMSMRARGLAVGGGGLDGAASELRVLAGDTPASL